MNELALSKRPRLTIGQKALFNLTCKKIQEKSALTFEESQLLYTLYGCREARDGVLYYMDWWDHKDENGNWREKLKPMNEYHARIATLTWLTHNIGSLVLKGYLKVLPVLELE